MHDPDTPRQRPCPEHADFAVHRSSHEPPYALMSHARHSGPVELPPHSNGNPIPPLPSPGPLPLRDEPRLCNADARAATRRTRMALRRRLECVLCIAAFCNETARHIGTSLTSQPKDIMRMLSRPGLLLMSCSCPRAHGVPARAALQLGPSCRHYPVPGQTHSRAVRHSGARGAGTFAQVRPYDCPSTRHEMGGNRVTGPFKKNRSCSNKHMLPLVSRFLPHFDPR